MPTNTDPTFRTTLERLKLAWPLPSHSFGDLVTLLMDVGVRPVRDKRFGRRWSLKDFSRTTGKSEHQLTNIRAGRSKSPQRSTYEAIERGLFGQEEGPLEPLRATLRHAYDAIQTNGSVFDKLENAPGTSQSLSAASEPLIVGLARIPLHFCGRDELLQQIHKRIQIAPGRIALHGPHGVGKTALAAAYAFKFRQFYRVIAWIDASSLDNARLSLATIGRRLNWAGTPTDTTDSANLTVDRLSLSTSDTLLIFDGALDPASLYPFIPNGSASILVTSNHRAWNGVASPMAVHSWSPDVSVKFLADRLGCADRDAAIAVATIVRNLPLGLELASVYCEKTGASLRDYHQRLLADRTVLVQAGQRIAGYREHLLPAISLSIHAAIQDTPSAKLVAQILVHLNGTSIPRNFLAEAILPMRWSSAKIEPLALSDGLACLENWSLIGYRCTSTVSEPKERQLIDVHPIVAIALSEVVDVNHESKEIASVALQNVLNRRRIDLFDTTLAVEAYDRLFPETSMVYPSALLAAEECWRASLYETASVCDNRVLPLARKIVLDLGRVNRRDSPIYARALLLIGRILTERVEFRKRGKATIRHALAFVGGASSFDAINWQLINLIYDLLRRHVK